MGNTYNFYNLEASFREYLLAGIVGAGKNEITNPEENKKALNNVSVKNYMSDFRHFVGWMTFYIKSIKAGSVNSTDLTDLITIEAVNEYKSYLLENSIPIKTINRRLSTVRKLCSFCISQGWLKENPGKKIGNVASIDESLNEFKNNLNAKGQSEIEVNSTLAHIKEFFAVINS